MKTGSAVAMPVEIHSVGNIGTVTKPAISIGGIVHGCGIGPSCGLVIEDDLDAASGQVIH
jgi:hypothetical protein